MIEKFTKDSKNVLIAGIGGGYDIFCGVPLFSALKAEGKQVHLLNFSFTDLTNARSERKYGIGNLHGFAGKVLHAPNRGDKPYFPEGYLAEWIGNDTVVWGVSKVGVAATAFAYQTLMRKLEIDTIIFVDGGVDSIMHGDEEGCATFLEDTVSLTAGMLACKNLNVKTILATIGFGTEIEDGLNHYRALENISTLTKDGGLLGVNLINDIESLRSAYNFVVDKTGSSSHITPKIIKALDGEFGGDEFYNILMGLYWYFDVDKVLTHNILASDKAFKQTNTWTDVTMVYRAKYGSLVKRPNVTLPL